MSPAVAGRGETKKHTHIWGVVRSELLKLWSLRAPRLILLLMFLLPVALATVRVLFVPLVVGTDLDADGTSVLFESISVSALPLRCLQPRKIPAVPQQKRIAPLGEDVAGHRSLRAYRGGGDGCRWLDVVHHVDVARLHPAQLRSFG